VVPAAEAKGAIPACQAVSVSNPFLVTGPAVISFSGGRTSVYMLWRVLQAHGGTLPEGVIVCFANTGREMPATLRFVQDCGEHWGVSIHWLEYRRDAETGRVFAEEVGPNSASRDGEPFAAMLQGKGFMPSPVQRFCTTELKVRTIRRWCVQNYGKAITWTQVVGLRADEPRRVERIMDPARQKKAGKESRNVVVPLAVAGITKDDVLAFWQQQPFDLGLRGSWEGNCDGCFLKRRSFITRLWQDAPERAAWWAKQEALAALKTSGRGNRFRKDWKGGYDGIRRAAAASPRLPMLDPDDDAADVFAACDTGCGA
jgi:3'-phosphoadenosine 5'-phosphosulfate sulfotransferase (PAPS reductase)/FAD synthetase